MCFFFFADRLFSTFVLKLIKTAKFKIRWDNFHSFFTNSYCLILSLGSRATICRLSWPQKLWFFFNFVLYLCHVMYLCSKIASRPGDCSLSRIACFCVQFCLVHVTDFSCFLCFVCLLSKCIFLMFCFNIDHPNAH